MHEIALRVPRQCVEAVLDDLMGQAPNGVFEVDRGDEVELRIRGAVDELPSQEVITAAAGRWLRWLGEREVPDGWLDQRRLDFEPVVVGERISIRPVWAPLPRPGLIDVALGEHPLAFGTGLHCTTAACLEWLVARENLGSLADLGCGSGILAIVAGKLGFNPVTALDHDAAAVAAARSNAAANRVKLEVNHVNLLEIPPPSADTWVANVPSTVHLNVAQSVVGRATTLLASGITLDEVDTVRQAYTAAGLVESSRRIIAGWAVIEFVGLSRAPLERD